MKAFLTAALALAVGAMTPIAAEDGPPRLTIALDRERLDVDIRFTGQDIAAFVVADDMLPGDELVVVLRGPDEQVRVARRTQRMGLWLDGPGAEFAETPGYYAVATTAPLAHTVAAGQRARLGLFESALPARAVGSRPVSITANLDHFRDALARLRAEEGLYTLEPQALETFPLGLARARFRLPPGAPVGSYEAQAYVFRNGAPIASARTPLDVRTVGLGRWLSDLSQRNPVIYGIMAISLAIATGALVTLVRR